MQRTNLGENSQCPKEGPQLEKEAGAQAVPSEESRVRLLAHKQNGFLEHYQQRRACLSLPEKPVRAPLQLRCLGG